MDAITLITQHLDVEKLLNYYDFNGIKNDGEIIRCCCKLHGGNNPTAFVINRDSGLWYCHTGDCGGGDVFSLVQRMENIKSFHETVQWVSRFFNVDIQDLPIIEKKYDYMKDLQKFINIVKSKRKKEQKVFTIPETIKTVTKYREFKQETMNHFQLGFVESVSLTKRNGEEYTLYNRLVFPIIFNNKQIGISFRKTKTNDFPKWSHQPSHLETKDVLYNYDEAKFSNQIIICEGITDVWAFYENNLSAVATFGSHITNEQYKLLLKTGADLILAFDGDEAGKTATEKAIKMFKNKANISVIPFQVNEDPESITREELNKRYEYRINK